MSKNKVALITGSAKRIGKQTAITLHNRGYNLVIHCNNSSAEAEQLVSQLNAQRQNSAAYLQADLTHNHEVLALAVQAVEVFGRIDVLVNNASSFYPTPVADVNEHQWQDLFGSNVKAPFFLSQQLQPELKRNKGVIINIVDIHADKPLKGYSVYCMAKSALVMMTKSLAIEFAPEIRVNAVAPGPILWHDNGLSPQDKSQVIDQVLLNRLGDPDNIAEAVSYLIQAEFVTGHILTVDGGRSLTGSENA